MRSTSGQANRPTGQQAFHCFRSLPPSLPSLPSLLPDLESLPGAGREKASLRLQRMSFALKTMGGATVGSAITTAGLGDWETGRLGTCRLTLNLNGQRQSEVSSSFGFNLRGEFFGTSLAFHGLLVRQCLKFAVHCVLCEMRNPWSSTRVPATCHGMS